MAVTPLSRLFKHGITAKIHALSHSIMCIHLTKLFIVLIY